MPKNQDCLNRPHASSASLFLPKFLSFLLCGVQSKSEWYLVKTANGEVNDQEHDKRQDGRVLETVNGETGRRQDGTYSLLIRNWL